MDKIQSTLVISLVFLAGCGDLTTNGPLTDPATGKPDAKLFGHWLTKNDKGETHLFIGKHDVESNPKSIMECVQVSWDPIKKKIETSLRPMYFTASTLKETSYANVFASGDDFADLSKAGSYDKWAAQESRRCNLLRYRCDGTELRLWVLREKLKSLDQDRGLTFLDKEKNAPPPRNDGKKAPENFVKRTVTADSLAAYLTKHGGDKLFSSPDGPFTFTRVPD